MYRLEVTQIRCKTHMSGQTLQHTDVDTPLQCTGVLTLSVDLVPTIVLI